MENNLEPTQKKRRFNDFFKIKARGSKLSTEILGD